MRTSDVQKISFFPLLFFLKIFVYLTQYLELFSVNVLYGLVMALKSSIEKKDK